MLALNLINPNIKKEILKEKIISLIRDVLFLLLFITLINSLFLELSNHYLVENFKEIKRQKEAIQIQNQPFNQDVSTINQKLKKVNIIQDEYTKWSNFLVALNKKIPAGIVLNQFSFDKKNNYLELNGVAATRDDFLILKKQLDESNLVKNLKSPLTNLLYQNNVKFSLNGEINLETIKP